MRLAPTGVAAAALLLTAALVASPTPAQADTCTAPELVSASVAPGTVVLGIATPRGFVVTVGVHKNGCTVKHVDTEVLTPTGVTNRFRLDEEATADGLTTYDVGVRVDPGAVGNADAGTWTSAVRVSWGTAVANAVGPRLRVVRAARLTTNATPEPVRAGRTLTLTGTLSRADWKTLRYAGYPQQHVQLQFRTLTGAYTTVKTVTSGAHGKVTTTVRPTQDGCYRLAYTGNSTTAKVTARGDCVDVR